MTDKLSENRKMTIAMADIQMRFSETQMRTAVITYDEFIAISNYIESLDHEIQMLACENHSLLSQEIQLEDYS